MNKVVVALSGGIDSAVSALLLKEQGYEVVGATMSFWDNLAPASKWCLEGCYGPQEEKNISSAKRICSILNIEHMVIDLRNEFKDIVLTYFISNYMTGKTPNPCVICNAQIKFNAFYEGIKKQGLSFDFFATGHYVRKSYNNDLQRWQILKGKDSLKDQSYFLCLLNQEQISKTLFPLGEKTKEEIKQIALDNGLGFLKEREESQDFIDASVYPYLFPDEAFIPGDIVDINGKVIGQHQGLVNYTIGQRKHIGISGMSEPYYVVGIDAEHNRLIIGPLMELYRDSLMARDINWVSIYGLKEEIRAETKIRLAHNAALGTLKPLSDNRVEVLFDEPQLSVTPGQFAVFYQSDLLLGGGVIE
ncbi:MAG: tRNA 2-thiouridine(34) synthase MnmA [Candidatus Cloacimonetes bacterium]|nr:tRNA 2-thiouridine(34) synthase MnmA [Candidatus Cloacimonadota bacterium]